jgi:DNA helicase HerA-like ATPase
MTTTTALPKLLRLTDPGLRGQLQALPASAALIGISTDGRAIAVDIDAAPHILVCSGTGGASTTILRTLTAQFLHQGAHALVLDHTRIAHLWAKDLPTSRTAATSPASTTPWSASVSSWSAAPASTATSTTCGA